MRYAMVDRIIIGAIAFSQFWLSLLSLGLGMTYIGGPLLLLFGIWGLITSIALAPSSIRARKSALVWHIIFVVFVVYLFAAARNPSPYILLWFTVGLAIIFYLGSGLDYLGSENK